MKIRNIILLTLLVALFLGCADREPTPGVTDSEILIGNIQDLSGPMKELGMALPHGSNLYFNYINGNYSHGCNCLFNNAYFMVTY